MKDLKNLTDLDKKNEQRRTLIGVVTALTFIGFFLYWLIAQATALLEKNLSEYIISEWGQLTQYEQGSYILSTEIRERVFNVNTFIMMIAVLSFVGMAMFIFFCHRKFYQRYRHDQQIIHQWQQQCELLSERYEKIKQDKEWLLIERNKYHAFHERIQVSASDAERARIAMFNLLKDTDEARREAEVSNQAKSVFLACVTHELRTPMNGIIGMLNSIMDFSLTKEQERYMKLAKFSSYALLDTLNEIIEYVKIKDKNLALNRVEFYLARVIKKSVEPFLFQFEDKKINFVLDLDPQLPEKIIGDPEKLRHVINNLVSNALKFTTKGEVRVVVKLMRYFQGEVTVEFHVTDTGIGIEPEKHEQIFKPFQQEDDSVTRKYGGVGLGLTLTQAWVEWMGGHLAFTSTLDKGSDFYFTLNFHIGIRALIPEISHEDEMEALTIDNIRDYIRTDAKILIIEDNPVNQVVIESYLERIGLKNIAIASNGKEAVEHPDLLKFDLIFSDIQMPVMDGFAFARHVRQTLNVTVDKLPIIALTAHSFAGEQTLCHEAGMNDYLVKPIEISFLLQMLAKWIPIAKTPTPSTISPTLAVAPVTPPIVTDMPKSPAVESYEALCVMNEETLDKMKLMLGDAFEKIFHTFLEDTSNKLLLLEAALHGRDFQTINMLAHQLKSSTASFGAESLSALLRVLEHESEERKYSEDPTVIMQKIRAQYYKLAEWLK